MSELLWFVAAFWLFAPPALIALALERGDPRTLREAIGAAFAAAPTYLKCLFLWAATFGSLSFGVWLIAG